MLDSEAADTAERDATEVEQLRGTISRLEEERRLMLDENAQLKEMLKREVGKADINDKKNSNIINDYKLVRHRLESQLLATRNEVDALKAQISSCKTCQAAFNDTTDDIIKAGGGDEKLLKPDDLTSALERIRELELELAQTKLAQVEAECRNQDLTHQLRSAEIELTSAKNSWSPWLTKTLSSIREVANKKDFTHFSYSQSNLPSTTPSFISHISNTKRESASIKNDNFENFNVRPDLSSVMKDSRSCNSLHTQH